MNPYWLAWTRGIITYCNLLARILVISLMEEFRREIVLKSPIEMGQSFLGIKVM
jgi:hypothetical protein